MDKLLGVPGSGKTTEMIRLSAKNRHYIVCMNPDGVADMARMMGLDIPLPISFTEFIEKKYYGKGIKGFIIDRADALLRHMSSVQISAVSMDSDDGWIQVLGKPHH